MTENENVDGCRHYFFDRHGGVSGGRYSSLNVGQKLGDTPDNVAENYRLIKSYAALDVLVSADQVHGDGIAMIGEEVASDCCIDSVDALVTNVSGTGLMVQLADCQGILLHDPVESVIAAIHAGWRGSVAGIIEKTVRKLSTWYSTDPKNLRAWISPSLGPCCAEFRNFKKELPTSFQRFQVKPSYFDFWEITRYQLRSAGVPNPQIEVNGICTSCSPDYFSYRRACKNGDGRTGRHCAVICL